MWLQMYLWVCECVCVCVRVCMRSAPELFEINCSDWISLLLIWNGVDFQLMFLCAAHSVQEPLYTLLFVYPKSMATSAAFDARPPNLQENIISVSMAGLSRPKRCTNSSSGNFNVSSNVPTVIEWKKKKNEYILKNKEKIF